MFKESVEKLEKFIFLFFSAKDLTEEESPSRANSQTDVGEGGARGGPSAARRRLLLSGGASRPAEEGAEPSAMSKFLRQPTKKPTPVPTPQPTPEPSIREPSPQPSPPLTPSKIIPITLPRYSSRDPLEEPMFAPIAEEESSVVTFPDDRSSLRSADYAQDHSHV